MVTELVSQMPDFLLISLQFAFLIGCLLLVNKVWKTREIGSSGLRYRRLLGLSILGIVGVVLIILFQEEQSGSIDHVVTLIGVLLSGAIALSSTTFISNFMAGIMLSRIDNFRPGDFLSVEEHIGRVTKMGLLHTEIQTEHSNLTTFPNLYLVTKPCKVVRKSKTVVSATVSLGYDVPHKKVKELLLLAVEKVPLKEPFVQIQELGDFSVVYSAAGILENAKRLISTKSKLREEMLDSLHGAGIEIVSPSFMNTRALSGSEQILSPADDSDDYTLDEAAPESIIFDKADEAESVEKIRSRHELLLQEVSVLKEKLKSATGKDSNDTSAEEKTQIEGEIQWRLSSISYLERRIKEDKDNTS